MKLADLLADRAIAMAREGADEDYAIARLTTLVDFNGRQGSISAMWPFVAQVTNKANRAAVDDAKAACAHWDAEPAIRDQALRWLNRVLRDSGWRQAKAETMAERVHRAFPAQAAQSDVREYFQAMRGDLKDIADAERRSAVLALLSALMFELINRAAIADVQVGPFKLQDLSLIQKALPVLLAYLVYDLVTLAVRYGYCRAACIEVVKLHQTRVRLTGLDRLLYPRPSSLFGPVWYPTASALDWITHVFTVVLRTAAVALPVAIEVYAFYRLIRTFATADLIIWCSMVLSLGFFLFAAVLYIVGLRTLVVAGNALDPIELSHAGSVVVDDSVETDSWTDTRSARKV